MRISSFFVFVVIIATFLFSSCGGGVSGENGSEPFSNNDVTSTNTIKIGFFDQPGIFTENQLGVLFAPVNGVFEVSAES
jgi:hypothetical protein